MLDTFAFSPKPPIGDAVDSSVLVNDSYIRRLYMRLILLGFQTPYLHSRTKP